ncbi:UDP-N-acetylmuramoyl-L-alanine--D-glutamate ligase [Alteromonas sediminis]|uniref:UDP-N-acetylmuramoylalanine--D-glutamate ligase n=1 Tax=Alteromonas sediminis TaxID=2259342 RepID=A0A3N5ZA57_9ALTE|nr:UDP-N-acetylmuramoyl-L-alanine--D-glutamate ligase [Alteromonas sediminis]RPJ67944.1 UDP-N-acetylmuramoyl-L-alanine--D-glutamate ligase [Alteromonas sediminis]
MGAPTITTPWNNLPDKHIVVVGLGKTGLSVASYLIAQGVNVTCWDTRDASDIASSERVPASAARRLGEQTDAFWVAVDGVVISPGIDPWGDALEPVRRHHIPLIGDIELFAYAISQRQVPPKLVGITGSNGKTTCTLLLTHLLNHAGIKAQCAGNVGKPALDCIDLDVDVLVLELSSFQLEMTSNLPLEIACFLNLSDDHLDRHGTIAHYGKLKQRIYNHALKAVYWREQSETIPVKKMNKTSTFGLNQVLSDDDWTVSDGFVCQGNAEVIAVNDIPMAGLHNAMNVMACCAMARLLDVPVTSLRHGVMQFVPPQHRCVTISNYKSVQWIDDSKATNPGATIAALKGLGPLTQGRLFLIAGGDGKGADFSDLAPVFALFVYKLIAMGKDGHKLKELHANAAAANSMEEAVDMINLECQKGDVVLLSPACASWDMFDNYEHRAAVFKSAVERVSAA